MNEFDLNFAIENGIVEESTILRMVNEMKNDRYLRLHPYSIWVDSNGYYCTHITTHSGKRKLYKRKTETELHDVIIDYYKSLDENPVVSEVFYMWVNEKMEFGEICIHTKDTYVNTFKKHFLQNPISKERIGNVTDDDLDYFIRSEITRCCLSAKAFSNLRIIIAGMWKYAKRRHWTELSISMFLKDLELSAKVFKKTKKVKELQVFSEDEIPKITCYLMEHPTIEHYGILLAFQTGIRVGELSGLKFSDVVNGQLHIQRQEVKYKSKDTKKQVHEIVEYTKTDNSDRYIFLTKSALDTIERIRKLNPSGDYMMMLGKRKIWTNTFNDRLYKVCDNIGIPRKSMHKIRKTYGTTLIDSGADEGLIASQMGHSSIETTRKYYYYSNKNKDSNLLQIERAINW